MVTYAVLQPITSLRATLAHIRPTKSIKLQELLRREGRPPCRASVRLGCYGDVGGGVATVAASELEIHANLSLLFPRQPQTTSLTESEKGFTVVLVTATRGVHVAHTHTHTHTHTHRHNPHTQRHNTHTHTHLLPQTSCRGTLMLLSPPRERMAWRTACCHGSPSIHTRGSAEER